mgnify:FL=1
MKKKIFFVILMMICLFGIAADVNAQEYKGALSNVIMNGKHFNDVANQKFILDDNGDGTYTLIGDVKQIGKMPGSIHVKLSISVNNGVISPTTNEESAGELKILKTFPVALILRNITGTLSSDHKTLHFTLETYAGWKLIPTFPASVTMFFMNSYDLIQDMNFTQSRDFMAGIKTKYSVKNWFTVHLSLHGDFYDRFKRHERIDERKKVYKSRILEPRVTLTSNYFTGHSLIFGIEHTSDDLTSDRFVNRKMTTRSLHETEYFLQDDWTPNDVWIVSAGVRTNFSKAFGFMWMPKIAAKYSLGEHWAFRANYSMGYRAPSIKELFFNWDHLGMFQIVGNEELKPEKNHYLSVGAEYSNRKFFINVNAYANFFRNKIEGVWKVYDMQYNFEYTNLNNQRLLGVETILKWHINDQFTLNGTYSYVNVSKLKGIQVNTSSPHAATASLDYLLNKKNYQLKTILSASLMGEKNFDVQDRVWVQELNKNHDAYFRCTLPTYVLCNLSFVQTLYNKVKITIGVDNLLNYVPKTLGSGVTLFNVPATCGARGCLQVEMLIDDIVKSIKRRR